MTSDKLSSTLSLITQQLSKLNQDNIISAYAYNVPETIEQTKTIGFALLFVFQNVDIKTLSEINTIKKTLRKYPIKLSIFTQEELTNALDVFPIEFLDMQNDRQLLLGDDILESVRVESTNLRHECEFYLRSHVLKLREGAALSSVPLTALIQHSFPLILTVFKFLLPLKGMEAPESTADLIWALSKEFGFDPEVFIRIIEESNSKNLPSHFPHYLRELETIIRHVDQL